MANVSILSCDVCQTLTTESTRLPCGHNFCQKCLKSSTTFKDSSECTTCQIYFEMTEDGLKNWKTNEQLKNNTTDFIECDICKKNQAIKFCVDCSCNYCSSCLEPHGRIPATRNHHLEPIPSKSEETATVKQPTCKEHSELINAFCKSCRVYICGRCLITTHKNHMVNHVSEQLDILKDEFEQNLKKKLKMLEKVDSNSKGSEDMILEIQLKASSMINDIKQRGEDVKNDVDSVVAKLIKIVEQELQHHQNRADIVMTKIESIKTTLKVEIEALKKQIKDLKSGNVPEISPNKIGDIDIDTKFSEKLNIFFYFDADEKMTFALRVFGNIERVPKLERIKHIQDTFKSNVQCFALHRGDIIYCNQEAFTLEVYRQSCRSDSRIVIRAPTGITKINDLAVIDDMVYVAFVSNDNVYYIFKCHLENSGFEPLQIHNRPFSHEGHVVRLSKSLSGNILFVLSRKITHLSTKGEVAKALNLPFDIFDALEFDTKRYVVSRLSEICTIDCNGNRLLTYSCCNNNPPLSFDIRALSVAKDNRGNIYVNDYWKKEILVLDQCLNLRSSVTVNKSVLDIAYDEDSDKLKALCDGSMNPPVKALDSFGKEYSVLTYEL